MGNDSSDNIEKVEWSADQPPVAISRALVERVNVAMLVLTSLVFVSRIAVQITKRKAFDAQEFFCCLSYICFVAMVVMYFMELDPLYRLEDVQRGASPPYPEILHDAGMVYQWLTSAQMLFYTSLLSVKISLLALYRRLLNTAMPMYTVMWWVILAFCILSSIGSALSTIFVCNDHSARYKEGICNKPDEQRRVVSNLWYAYAVDVATDLAVMFLPFCMTWNLRLPRKQKLGIFVIFGSGWICILFATLRVVQTGVKDGVPKVPDSKWLIIWTVIETSMAVIIGCAPAFAALRRRTEIHNVERSMGSYQMKSAGIHIDSQPKSEADMLRTDRHGSEEALDPYTPGLAC
ncbi:hypothetical protein BDW02DRAFT_574258 [Decorospora gaudefroyi]|uniref:Rhodopsin domain-containing protein n=1 Tax=Decorospora gaudefroyi TaxID=184978 RepID=A0A6A5K4B7_9PLEO|nr:hypothetical protein BDW02DRAFT_574258 [Decorospora gaudefroyi]